MSRCYTRVRLVSPKDVCVEYRIVEKASDTTLESSSYRMSERTEIKVPGRKHKVTKVITLIETVSVFVLSAMWFISTAILSILTVEVLDWPARSLLLSLF